ncbi:leucine-rich repeat domain-containing protein [Periweissella cryptocerci]|uniref:Leucine-rich repeat domain-containing protein n=1 Tax=Periweissella cryptocerci TaxID=2506420 RepID=A0A4P6YRB9_9LACO|nr:Ig-like domain-containing protein [Periweissella cryptocerci]QBO35189.1 leucine-rich repeat domain-containing protein [Periweissella cryptocerci]
MEKKKIIAVGMTATMLFSTASVPGNVLAASHAESKMEINTMMQVKQSKTNLAVSSTFAELIPDVQLQQAIIEYATTDEGYLTDSQKQSLISGDKAQAQAVLATITRLNLMNCGLDFMTIAGINQLRNLQFLNLQGNTLASIGAQTFVGMNHLQFLYLDNIGLITLNQDAFGKLPQLKTLGLTQNAALINFDALYTLDETANINGGTFGGVNVSLWEAAINKVAGMGDLAPLVASGSNLSKAIQFAQFKYKLLQLENMKIGMVEVLELKPVLGASVVIKNTINDLKAAVEANDTAWFTRAGAQLYAEIHAEIMALENRQIGQLGVNIVHFPAVAQAKAALEATNTSPDYHHLAECVVQLETAIAAFVSNTRAQTADAIKNAQSKKEHTAVKELLVKAQIALAGYNYDQMIKVTNNLNTTVKQITKSEKSPVQLKQAYHLHKYVTGTAVVGTKIVVKKAGKVARSTVGASGKFKVKMGKLKNGQQITITADTPDSVTTLYKLASKSMTVKQSPKPTLKQLKIKGKKVTGKTTTGATVKVYKGKKLVSKKVVKTGNIKFKVKQKFAKKTKLTVKIQNDDEHGLAVKKWTTRVR